MEPTVLNFSVKYLSSVGSQECSLISILPMDYSDKLKLLFI